MFKNSPLQAWHADRPLPYDKIQLVKTVRGMTLRVLESNATLHVKGLLVTHIPTLLWSNERGNLIIRKISCGNKLEANVHHEERREPMAATEQPS